MNKYSQQAEREKEKWILGIKKSYGYISPFAEAILDCARLAYKETLRIEDSMTKFEDGCFKKRLSTSDINFLKFSRKFVSRALNDAEEFTKTDLEIMDMNRGGK